MSDDPTEQVQEDIGHRAGHATHHTDEGNSARWITAAAMTAALLAAFAAVTGALATTHLTEATHRRIESNDKWSYFQAKSLKSSLLETKGEILAALDHKQSSSDLKRIGQYELEKKETRAEAEALEKLSMSHLRAHETFEMAATMFHISIAVVAISVVARKRVFWHVSIFLGIVGVTFFTVALLRAPADEAKGRPLPGVVPEKPATSTEEGSAAAR
jgi:hypothetical protein